MTVVVVHITAVSKLNVQRVNVNMPAFYYIGCCLYCDSLEMKYPVSGAKSVQFYPKQMDANMPTFYYAGYIVEIWKLHVQ